MKIKAGGLPDHQAPTDNADDETTGATRSYDTRDYSIKEY
jgi:hypothetical protein